MGLSEIRKASPLSQEEKVDLYLVRPACMRADRTGVPRNRMIYKCKFVVTAVIVDT